MFFLFYQGEKFSFSKPKNLSSAKAFNFGIVKIFVVWERVKVFFLSVVRIKDSLLMAERESSVDILLKKNNSLLRPDKFVHIKLLWQYKYTSTSLLYILSDL